MNSIESSYPRTPTSLIVARLCALLALLLLIFFAVTVALAFHNHDVPQQAWHRWKNQPVFANYFFATRLAALASTGVALMAAVLKPSRGHLILLIIAICSIVAHGRWESYLRQQ